ncbi:MAG: hypothetical protein JSS49_09635 [Planctomycetes bacterium]|nr:hypothetical protein [Planctomycetota bacterium]
MAELLYGWQRKAGCVTLVIAAGLLCGWLRSQSRVDRVTVSLQDIEHTWFSDRDGIAWHKSVNLDPAHRYVDARRKWISWTFGMPHTDAHNVEKYRRKRFGFYGNSGVIHGFSGEALIRVHMWGVSYMVVLVPLTVLSASLLLRKSRKSTNGS